MAAIPLLQRGGRDLKKISPKASADGSGRGGQKIFDHPVCATKVASQYFFDGAATPPPEEGNSSGFTISAIHSYLEEQGFGFHSEPSAIFLK
jgi:hypothetical protein